jgi:peptidoglycan/LPS O-acetylase OafA/YrhL
LSQASGTRTPPFSDGPSQVQPTFGAFGVYRYCLALLVVLDHAGPTQFAFTGEYAVFAFYLLSGYVVAYSLDHEYFRTGGGLWRYFLNRILRVYPLYWVVFSFALWITILFPIQSREIIAQNGVPDKLLDWSKNIFTFGMVNAWTGEIPLNAGHTMPLVVGPAWSLGVELSYWLVMPLLLTVPAARWGMMLFALIYTIAVCRFSIASTLIGSQSVRYYSALAASLPFSLGLALFIRKRHHKINIGHLIGIGSMMAFVIVMGIQPRLPYPLQLAAFYLSIALNLTIVSYLSGFCQNGLAPSWRKLDGICGHIAFPLYLLHVPTIILLHVILPSLGNHNCGVFLISMLSSSVLAWFAYRVVEVRVERWRSIVKARFPEVDPIPALAIGR